MSRVRVLPPRAGRRIDAFGSEGVLVDPLARAEGRAALTLIRLDPGGVLGGHEAPTEQLMRVLQGNGVVLNREQVEPVDVGVTVLWEKGEWHETRAGGEGLVLAVLEGAGLQLP